MSNIDELAEFVREGLAAGRTPDELGAALTQAGWGEREVAAEILEQAREFVVEVVRRSGEHRSSEQPREPLHGRRLPARGTDTGHSAVAHGCQ